MSSGGRAKVNIDEGRRWTSNLLVPCVQTSDQKRQDAGPGGVGLKYQIILVQCIQIGQRAQIDVQQPL